MANGGRIDWTIGFKYDKTGLNQVTADLNRIASMTTEDFMKINPKFNTEQAEKELEALTLCDKAKFYTTGIQEAIAEYDKRYAESTWFRKEWPTLESWINFWEKCMHRK